MKRKNLFSDILLRIAGVAIVLAFLFALLGIWIGDGRLGGTAALLFVLAALASIVGAGVWEDPDPKPLGENEVVDW